MTRPPLVFEPGLIEYLARHGSAVTLRASLRHGCCGGSVGVPVAEAGAPARSDDYQLIERDGVRVYLESGLADGAEGPITIGVDGFGPWRSVWVSGLTGRM